MVRQHLGNTAGQVREGQAIHVLADCVDFGRASLGGGLDPHVEADIVCFHRVIGHALASHFLLPRLDERIIRFAFRGLEIVPGCQVTDKVRGVQTGELFLTDRKSHDRNVVSRYTGGRKLLVEANVGVTVDGRDHANLLAVGAQGHNVGNNLRPVGMTERSVVDEDVIRRNAFVFQILLKNLVGRPRIDIICS